MQTRAVRLAAVALAGLVAGAVLTVSGRPAWAVQTSTWGIVAAPSGPARGYRPVITDPASGRKVTDSVIVWNRTSAPLTVHLSVLSVSDPSGTYQYSTQLSGLAARVHLAAGEVTLGPYQQAMIPVTIDEPSGLAQAQMAAIAGESQPVHDGVLSVEERLAVLIRSTPAVAPAARPSGATAASVVFLGTIGAALIAIAVLLMDRERRRKEEEVVAEAVSRAPISPELLAALPPPTSIALMGSEQTAKI